MTPHRDHNSSNPRSLSTPTGHTAMRSYPPQQWLGRDLAIAANSGHLTSTAHPERQANDIHSITPNLYRNAEHSDSNVSGTNTPGFGNSSFSAEPNCDAYQVFPNGSSNFDLGSLSASNQSRATQFNHLASGAERFTHGIENFTWPDEFRSWHDQFDFGIQFRNDQFGLFRNGDRQSSEIASRTHPVQRTLQRPPSHRYESVPNELFQRVEQCWPQRSGNRFRVMHTLWKDMCNLAMSNLFNEPDRISEPIPQERLDSSRWGLDTGVRDRLESLFGTTCGAEHRPNRTGGQESVSQSDQSPIFDDVRSKSTHFPPAEIFDMGMDLYFRHFHPLIPFVHIPTFCPKSADFDLLFIMCLIGLTLIDSNGSIAFVQQSFDVGLKLSL